MKRHFSTRIPPTSLLIKQATRLGKLPPPKTSEVVGTAFRDLKALFSPGSIAEEDEQADVQQRDEILQSQVNNGEFTKLLHSKFDYDESTQMLSTTKLINNFTKLTADENELLKKGISMGVTPDWKDVPPYQKQLQFYIAFGSYGPRSKIPFAIGSQRPKDMTFNKPAKVSNNPSELVRKLGTNDLANLPNTYLSNAQARIDPFTAFFLFCGLSVPLIVLLREHNTRNEETVYHAD